MRDSPVDRSLLGGEPDYSSKDVVRTAVVIPCHDDGATLPESLASLKGPERFEVVVVDDGSTNRLTLDVLNDLERDGVTVVRQQNAGPAAARMAGVRATSAPFVFPLDADDVAISSALASLADALEAHDDADFAWGDLEFFGERSGVEGKAEFFDPWLLTYLNQLPGSALFRREALVAVGGWSAKFGYEDWDLWLALAEHGFTGIRIDTVVFRYRIVRGRGWAQHSNRHADIFTELQARHRALFARRRANWRTSPASWRLKLLLPVIDRTPFLSPYGRWTLQAAVDRPSNVLRALRSSQWPS